jgi:hypothetical protein
MKTWSFGTEAARGNRCHLVYRSRSTKRVELDILERLRLLARRQVLYEQRYPQTKHGGAPGAGRGKVSRAQKDVTVTSFQTEEGQGPRAQKNGESPSLTGEVQQRVLVRTRRS